MLALLVARYRRLDLAEDGLADAVEAAARTWPRDGVPANPAAWLLTAARLRAVDRLRTEAAARRVVPALAVQTRVTEGAQRVMADAGEPLTDERLRLVLLCAHPSLPRDAAAALTLRLVLGVPTADVARLFLVSTPTMAARLTRARKRLAGEVFALPAGAELATRVAVVCDVAYLTFTAGYAPASGDEPVRVGLAGQALRLVRVLRDVLPTADPDVDALLALMLLQHARRDARVADDGGPVLLPDQDRERWHHDEIAEALTLLRTQLRRPGTPYLLQAMVAAEHAVAARAEHTDWRRIAAWYDELEALTGSAVVRLNRAVAVAECDGPQVALALLEGLDDHLTGHRLPATRAELLVRAGRTADARAAFDVALSRCDHGAERRHLAARRDAVPSRPCPVSRPRPPG